MSHLVSLKKHVFEKLLKIKEKLKLTFLHETPVLDNNVNLARLARDHKTRPRPQPSREMQQLVLFAFSCFLRRFWMN
jgi:hypothetical protein